MIGANTTYSEQIGDGENGVTSNEYGPDSGLFQSAVCGECDLCTMLCAEGWRLKLYRVHSCIAIYNVILI